VFRALLAIGFLACAVSSSESQSPWVLRPDGIGRVRIGMTLPQANVALNEHFSAPENEGDQSCFYVTPKAHPQLALMIEDSHLVRIDVNQTGIRTAEGLGIGDTETRARKAYGADLHIEPSKYTGDEGGHYLTIRSGKYGIRFETEHRKVTQFYAGTYEAIQYVEGCE